MTVWIEPTEALADQLDVAPVPLPVADSTAAAMRSGVVDVSVMVRDVDAFLVAADPADPKMPALSRGAAALAMAAARGKTDEGDHAGAADLLRIAVKHAPDDAGIRALYGWALWASGQKYGGLAQLTDAVNRNSDQDRVVPMLWIVTARAMADAGRHGDALLLLEELAATEPLDYRFWELIDSIDARGSGIEFRPDHADEIRARLEQAVASSQSDFNSAWTAVGALGITERQPRIAPPLCLEVTSLSPHSVIGAARPGTLGMLDSTVAVVRSDDSSPAPTPGRTTVDLQFGSNEGSIPALVAVGIDGSADKSRAIKILETVAAAVAAFPRDEGPPGDPFQHDLGPEASLAMAAVLDGIGTAYRLGVPASGLPISALTAHADYPDMSGIRQSIDEFIGDVGDVSDPLVVDSGLRDLARLGFLEIEADRVMPVPYFGYLMSGIGNHLAWRRFTHHNTHARSLTRRYWLATGAGVLRLAPNGVGGVAWSVVTRDAMQHELGVELAIVAN